jgi:serine/threonine protein kinase
MNSEMHWHWNTAMGRIHCKWLLRVREGRNKPLQHETYNSSNGAVTSVSYIWDLALLFQGIQRTFFSTDFTGQRMMNWWVDMCHIKLTLCSFLLLFYEYFPSLSLLIQAKGMNYLHKRNPPIVHRDLKSPNLLVDKKYTVKVWFSGFTYISIRTNNTFCQLLEMTFK